MVRRFHASRYVLLGVLLSAVADAGMSAQAEFVIHKEGTTLYHRAACPVVRGGKGVLALTRAQAESRGFKPHAACDPANTDPDSTGSSKEPAEPQPQFVHVDTSKYYHRATCARLGKDSKRVELEKAGKKYWPCPRCRPPIRKKSAEPAIPKRERRD